MTLLEKAEAVLALSYHGLHNVPGKIKAMRGVCIEVRVPISLATVDFDGLTRLVIGAHDQCVRLSLRHAGPGHIILMFHDRQREGDWSHRHPTIEEAIATIRKP